MSKHTPYMEKYLYAGLVMLLSLLTLAGCASLGPSPALSGTPITIGTSISRTGDFSDDGKALEQGYTLWQNAINKQGGLLGRPVKFDFLTDDSTGNVVAANYQKMITVNHDDLVVGPFSTGLTIASSAVANQHKYAFIEGAGVAPAVFAPQYNNLFSVSLSATSYLTSFVYFILSLPQAQRPRTIAYVTSDDFFTQPQIDTARGLLEAGGEKTVLNKSFTEDTNTNYTSLADLIISANPDVVILGTNGQQDSVAFMKAFEQQHFNPKAIIATAGPDQGGQFSGPLGGPHAVEGIFVPNGGWFPTVNNYQNSQFVQDYIAQYGGSASDISADTVEAYSVGQVLQQAVTRIHSIDNARLIEELHADTFNTLQGPVKFASDGENTVAVAFLFQWQNGQLIVAYPNYAAQENPEYPKPAWP